MKRFRSTIFPCDSSFVNKNTIEISNDRRIMTCLKHRGGNYDSTNYFYVFIFSLYQISQIKGLDFPKENLLSD